MQKSKKAQPAVAKVQTGVDIAEKVRELLVLAKEQGHITGDDITETLADSGATAECASVAGR